MLQSNQQDGWNEMPPEERSRVATSLTQTMESTAYEIASLLNMTSQIEIATDNISECHFILYLISKFIIYYTILLVLIAVILP